MNWPLYGLDLFVDSNVVVTPGSLVVVELLITIAVWSSYLLSTLTFPLLVTAAVTLGPPLRLMEGFGDFFRLMLLALDADRWFTVVDIVGGITLFLMNLKKNK